MSSTPLAITGEVNCWKRWTNSVSSEPRRTKEQHFGDEVEEAGVDIGTMLIGALDGLENFVAVFLSDFIAVGYDVSSVDVEAG